MNRRDFIASLAGATSAAALLAGCASSGSRTSTDEFGRRDLPREPLITSATPLEELPRLSAALGGPRILVKRDDLTPTGMGGNKVRKLEYLAAAARRAGADTLVTVGGVQSNHCRQTAAVAARLGFACELVLSRTAKSSSALYMESGNFALDRLYGARVHVLDAGADRSAAADEVVERLARSGARPYFIGAGGSDEIGSMGYRRSGHELLEQLRARRIAARAIYHASGSAGTQSGLVYAMREARSATSVEGITVGPRRARVEARIAELLDGMATMLAGPEREDARIRVADDYIGEGYGLITEPGREAIDLCARLEGLTLDPTYTGKAMAALIDHVRQGRYDAEDTIVFLHTGGAPALFAYEEFTSAG